ncbi:MAG TPA: hypothetical protein VEH27_05925 [Methylomirabilota bacterium]|nr:hypothetical protein [Methylomirabilota bacterium]
MEQAKAESRAAVEVEVYWLLPVAWSVMALLSLLFQGGEMATVGTALLPGTFVKEPLESSLSLYL